MTSSTCPPSKRCENCGAEFTRRQRDSWADWEARKICSRSCRPSVEQRLWAKVDQGVPDACWPWTGSLSSTGRGNIRTDRKVSDPVHRVAWTLLVGSIPDGLQVHHRCENPICCNPAHMELLSPGEHTRITDGGSFNRAKDRCPQGHPYDEANTYVYRGRRACRRCRQEAARRYRARRGA